MAVANSLNSGATISLGGSLSSSGAVTFSGSFPFVANVSANTNVTFPTSGTLATSSGASIPSIAQGGILYGSASNVLSALAKDTNATRYLSNTGTSNNPAWAQIVLTTGVTGVLLATNGGTGVNNGSNTITLGGSLATSGAFNSTFTMTNTTTVTFPTSGTLATTSQIPTGAALTKSDDTNVTLTLGGSPTTALVNAASIAVGWTGTLSTTRGGSGVSNPTAHGVLIAEGVSAFTPIVLTAGQHLVGTTAGDPVGVVPTTSSGMVLGVSSGAFTIDNPNSIGGANLLINGNFAVWQRTVAPVSSPTGTVAVPASTTAYTADRWQLLTNANQNCTVLQQTVNNSNTFVCSIRRDSGQTGIGTIRLCQSITIDRCTGAIVLAAGQSITASFTAKCGTGYTAAGSALVINAYTGTGNTSISGINGAFTGNVTNTTSITLTTTYQRFSYTFTAGNAITQMALEFAFTPVGTAAAGDTFQIYNIKLAVEPTATPFVPMSFDETLKLCQRFYWKTFLQSLAPAQNVGIGTGEFLFPASALGALTDRSTYISFPVPMQATPSITLFNPAATNAQIRDETNSVDTSASTTASLTANGLALTCTGNASSTIGAFLGVHILAVAELT